MKAYLVNFPIMGKTLYSLEDFAPPFRGFGMRIILILGQVSTQRSNKKQRYSAVNVPTDMRKCSRRQFYRALRSGQYGDQKSLGPPRNIP